MWSVVCSCAPQKHAAELRISHRYIWALHLPMPVRRRFSYCNPWLSWEIWSSRGEVEDVTPHCGNGGPLCTDHLSTYCWHFRRRTELSSVLVKRTTRNKTFIGCNFGLTRGCEDAVPYLSMFLNYCDHEIWQWFLHAFYMRFCNGVDFFHEQHCKTSCKKFVWSQNPFNWGFAIMFMKKKSTPFCNKRYHALLFKKIRK